MMASFMTSHKQWCLHKFLSVKVLVGNFNKETVRLNRHLLHYENYRDISSQHNPGPIIRLSCSAGWSGWARQLIRVFAVSHDFCTFFAHELRISLPSLRSCVVTVTYYRAAPRTSWFGLSPQQLR